MADRTARRLSRRLKLALFGLSDWLCAWAGAGTAGACGNRWLFEAGHQAGELGWRLRQPLAGEPGAWRACFECGHVYRTPEELRREWAESAPPDLPGRETPPDAGQIDFCPLCMHGW